MPCLCPASNLTTPYLTSLHRARFRPGHITGGTLCVAGLAVLLATDRSSETGGPAPVLGDALVLVGAVVYALSNVVQASVRAWKFAGFPQQFSPRVNRHLIASVATNQAA
jgi:drug/metabolite transporter (DMT)-like permease